MEVVRASKCRSTPPALHQRTLGGEVFAGRVGIDLESRKAMIVDQGLDLRFH
jgi:hypothetical protein